MRSSSVRDIDEPTAKAPVVQPATVAGPLAVAVGPPAAAAVQIPSPLTNVTSMCIDNVFKHVQTLPCECGCHANERWLVYLVFALLILIAGLTLSSALLTTTANVIVFALSLAGFCLALIALICIGASLNSRCVKQVVLD